MDTGVKNIDELRQFGHSIQLMGEQMMNVMQQAEQRLAAISQNWHDTKNEQFRASFTERVKTIRKMSDDFKEYNQYIKRTCDILDQYKNNTLNL
jgi:hypothetical protein